MHIFFARGRVCSVIIKKDRAQIVTATVRDLARVTRCDLDFRRSWMHFVNDMIVAPDTQRFVFPVQHNVSTITQALDAVRQKYPSGSDRSHKSSWLTLCGHIRSIFLSGFPLKGNTNVSRLAVNAPCRRTV